jgi:hypothetical protein
LIDTHNSTIATKEGSTMSKKIKIPSDGRTRYTIGLDMQCKRVVCKVSLVETRGPNENGFDCVILCDDGIRVLAKKQDLFRTRTEARAAL